MRWFLNVSAVTALWTLSALSVLAVSSWNAPHVMAQAPPADSQKFEVASIKANKSGAQNVSIGLQPGGRYTVTNAPLRALIRQAYQLQDFQLVGGPDWVRNDRFDILAKAEGNVMPTPPGTVGPMQLMVRALLAERFKLVVHTEKRDMPIYALVLARPDGRLGSQLKKSTTDCQAMMTARLARGGTPPVPPAAGQPILCGMQIGPGNMQGGGFPISQLASSLSQFVQRTVVDKTGLEGNYDLTLTYTPEQIGTPPRDAQATPSDTSGPSIFTALQEQLGLKLDSQRGPVDVLVIDSVEHPTEN